jgi:hypothetical protein
MAVMCQIVNQIAWNLSKSTTLPVAKWVYLPLRLIMPHDQFLHNVKITKVCKLYLT